MVNSVLRLVALKERNSANSWLVLMSCPSLNIQDKQELMVSVVRFSMTALSSFSNSEREMLQDLAVSSNLTPCSFLIASSIIEALPGCKASHELFRLSSEKFISA